MAERIDEVEFTVRINLNTGEETLLRRRHLVGDSVAQANLCRGGRLEDRAIVAGDKTGTLQTLIDGEKAAAETAQGIS